MQYEYYIRDADVRNAVLDLMIEINDGKKYPLTLRRISDCPNKDGVMAGLVIYRDNNNGQFIFGDFGGHSNIDMPSSSRKECKYLDEFIKIFKEIGFSRIDVRNTDGLLFASFYRNSSSVAIGDKIFSKKDIIKLAEYLKEKEEQ